MQTIHLAQDKFLSTVCQQDFLGLISKISRLLRLQEMVILFMDPGIKMVIFGHAILMTFAMEHSFKMAPMDMWLHKVSLMYSHVGDLQLLKNTLLPVLLLQVNALLQTM